MKCIKDSTTNDGFVWRCPKHKGSKVTVRKNSWLEASHLTSEQFITLAYLWAFDTKNYQAAQLAGLSRPAVVQHYQFFRDVCSNWLIENPPQMLGGPGVIAEIDESLVAKRKYNRGRLTSEVWVFGIFDLEKKIGHLQAVPDRSAAKLLQIIQEKVLSGSVIHSDE